MSTPALAEVISALDSVATWNDYAGAKRRAVRLSRPDQLRVVDSFIAAYRRLTTSNAAEISRPLLRAV